MKKLLGLVVLSAVLAFVATIGLGQTTHGTTLTWGASTTPGVTYNVYRGTTSGGESATPQNASPITGLTYFDPVTLTSNPQTFFYYIEAVEISSGITLNSVPSNEISVTFPGIPAPPTSATGTPK